MLNKTSEITTETTSAFRDWLQKPAGKRLLNIETERLSSIIPTLYGYEAMLIGEPAFAQCIERSTIKNKIIVHPEANIDAGNLSVIQAEQDSLPIGTALMDLVYLAHCLEFAANPHEVLREAYRILRADGHLLISVFNINSIWGTWRGVAKFGNNHFWKSNFMSIARLKDWLALLGFDIMRVNYFGFNLPIHGCSQKPDLTWIERYGQKIELPVGAAFLVEASKRVIPLTPIAATWRKEPDLIEDDITEPT